MAAENTDDLIINRNNTTQTQQVGTLMANLEDTDLLLVNRSNQSYTITGSDLKESVTPALSLNATISGSIELGGTLTAVGSPSGGFAPYTYTYQWKRSDSIIGSNQSDIAGATISTYSIVEADVDKFISCEVVVTDNNSDTITDMSNYVGPVVGDSGPLSSVAITTKGGVAAVPNFIAVCNTDVSEILDGSVITYQWYSYSSADSNDGIFRQATTSASNLTDEYEVGANEISRFIGCTVSYLGITVSETTRLEIGVPDGAIARMNGLRFDHSRATGLKKPTKADSYQGTISLWLKQTDRQGTQDIFSSAQNSFTRYSQLILALGQFKWWANPNGTDYSSNLSNTILELNEWYHIVVNYGADEVSDNGIWINGVKDTADMSDFYTNMEGEAYINNGHTFTVGGRWNGTIGVIDEIFRGYISDYYFVEDRLLPPETFAQDFVLGWGPLDYTTVLENIGVIGLSPYDNRPNMDEKWSDGKSGDWTADATNMFDGDLTTSDYKTELGATAVVTFTGLTAKESIRVYGSDSASPGSWKITLDNVATPVWSTSTTNAWTDVPFTGEVTINSISNDGWSGNVYAIEVDGRILVDGPANNSQNWSENGTTDYAGATPLLPITLAFSGNLTQEYGFNGGTSSTNETGPTFTFGTSIPNVTSVRIYGQMNYRDASGDTASAFQLNGRTIDTTTMTRSAKAWFEFPSVTAQNPITLTGFELNNYDTYMDAIEVNGEILVNSGAQWNTSQVWSDYAVAEPTGSGNIEALFNGQNSPTNKPGYVWSNDGNPDPSYLTIVDGMSLPATTFQFTADIGSYNWKVRINDTDEYDIGGQANNVNSGIPTPPVAVSSGVINKIELSYSGNGSTVWSLIADGQVLVNGGTFGANGFFLPFDPEATGVNYSTGGDNTGFGAGSWQGLFNGNDTESPYITGAKATYTFPTPVTGQIGFAMWGGGSSETKASVTLSNGTELSVTANSTDLKWVYEDVSNITEFTMNGDDTGGVGMYLAYVSLDGKILVDHNSIGVDASGNGNNFHDKNFGVGNTSQFWSGYLGGPGTVDDPRSAFDGDINDYPQMIGSNNYVVWEPPTPITATDKIRLRLQKYTNGDNQSLVFINGDSSDSSRAVNVTAAAPTWYDLSTLTLESIYLYDNNVNQARLCAVEVDGVLLIDSYLQDTVLDTPMNNYAVLDRQGENGGLVANNILGSGFDPITSLVMDSGKYYAEFTPVTGFTDMHLFFKTGSVLYQAGGAPQDGFTPDTSWDISSIEPVGVAVDTTTGQVDVFVNGIHNATAKSTSSLVGSGMAGIGGSNEIVNNWGQHPFSGSNVTDNGDGTVTLANALPDTSQVWSDRTSITGTGWVAGRPISNIYTGALTNDNADVPGINNGSGTIEFNPPITGNLIELNGASANKSITINDGDTIQLLDDNFTGTIWNDSNVTSLSKISLTGDNFGGTFLRAIRVDGKILVDPNPALNASRVWSDDASVTTGPGFEVGSDYPISNMFDGDTGTYAATLSGGYTDITFDPPIPTDDSLRIFALNTAGPAGDVKVNGTAIGATGVSGFVSVTGVTSISTISLYNNPSVLSVVFAIETDSKLFVDPTGFPGGTYNKLQKTWKEWVVLALRAAATGSQLYRDLLFNALQSWQSGIQYETGNVIKHEGTLYKALTDHTSSSSNDPTDGSGDWQSTSVVDPYYVAPPTTTTVAVTVAGGYYYIDGVQQDSITMNVGDTITFDQSDSSNSGHPLAIYTTADKQGTAPGNINPSGTDVSYTPDTAGVFYYQCASHSNMGGSITVS